MMSSFENFMYNQSVENQRILEYLHELFINEPQVNCKIRYKVPFYYRNSWICYLNPKKKGGLELCFVRANELANANGLLAFRDRTQVAGVIYQSVSDINEEALMETYQEALLLDETVKYKSKRSKK